MDLFPTEIWLRIGEHGNALVRYKLRCCCWAFAQMFAPSIPHFCVKQMFSSFYHHQNLHIHPPERLQLLIEELNRQYLVQTPAIFQYDVLPSYNDPFALLDEKGTLFCDPHSDLCVNFSRLVTTYPSERNCYVTFQFSFNNDNILTRLRLIDLFRYDLYTYFARHNYCPLDDNGHFMSYRYFTLVIRINRSGHRVKAKDFYESSLYDQHIWSPQWQSSWYELSDEDKQQFYDMKLQEYNEVLHRDTLKLITTLKSSVLAPKVEWYPERYEVHLRFLNRR